MKKGDGKMANLKPEQMAPQNDITMDDVNGEYGDLHTQIIFYKKRIRKLTELNELNGKQVKQLTTEIEKLQKALSDKK